MPQAATSTQERESVNIQLGDKSYAIDAPKGLADDEVIRRAVAADPEFAAAYKAHGSKGTGGSWDVPAIDWKTGKGAEELSQRQAHESLVGAADNKPANVPYDPFGSNPGGTIPGSVPGPVHEVNSPQSVVKTAGPLLKWGGAAALTAAGPETWPAAVGLAALGGGAGEAANQLARRGVDLPAPATSKESAQDIGKAGGETGAAEAGSKLVGGVLKAGAKIVNRGGLFVPEIAPGLTAAATKNLQEPAARQGVESIFSALSPSDANLAAREDLSYAARDLKTIALQTPLTKRGGILTKDFRTREFANNVSNYMDDLWNNIRAPQITRNASVEGSLKQAKQAMLDSVSRVDKEAYPGASKAVEREVSAIPDKETLAELDARRLALRARLDKFNSGTGSQRSVTQETQPKIEAAAVQYREVLDEINRILLKKGESGVSEFGRRYGALGNVRDMARSQLNSLETQKLGDKLLRYIPLFRGGQKAAANIIANPSAGSQLENGLERLAESNLPLYPSPRMPAGATRPMRGLLTQGPIVTPPPADLSGPMEGPGPQIQPLAENRQLPAAGATTGPRTVAGPSQFGITAPETNVPNIPPPAAGPRALPAAPVGPGAPVAPYRRVPPVAISGPQEAGEGAAQSFGSEAQPAMRVVGQGSTRHAEIWNAKRNKWVKVDWPLSASPE